MNNFVLLVCVIFYGTLCIFSIVTGLIYASGKKKLNPLELPDKFIEKLNDENKLKSFTIKMGWLTFIVGIIQGITAYGFYSKNLILYIIACGFNIFSIFSVLFKLKGKINAFPLLKLVAYIFVLVVSTLNFPK